MRRRTEATDRSLRASCSPIHRSSRAAELHRSTAARADAANRIAASDRQTRCESCCLSRRTLSLCCQPQRRPVDRIVANRRRMQANSTPTTTNRCNRDESTSPSSIATMKQDYRRRRKGKLTNKYMKRLQNDCLKTQRTYRHSRVCLVCHQTPI